MPARSTRQLSITLPTDMAARVKERVASGEYASESEVIRDGLRVLQARDRALDAWLRIDVARSYDRLKADRGSARTSDEVLEALAAEHRRVTGASAD